MQTPFSEFVRTVEALDPRHPRVRRWIHSPELGPRPGGLAALRAELMAEAAAALGRAEQRVLAELDRLRSMGGSIDELEKKSPATAGGVDPPQRDALALRVDAFNRQRQIAQRRLWELMVQREALGFYRNDILTELYPIPPPRSVATAPKE